MTYYGSKELARSFRTVRGNTVRIAEDIPEGQYDFKAAPNTKSVGQILVHIALGSGFQYHVQSNKIDDLMKVNFPELMQKSSAEEAKPRSKAEVVALLKAEGEKFASFLEGLSEPFLAEAVKMPTGVDPTTKSRLEMLLSPKEHEMHHRGQLMLIQRLIGIVPHLTRAFEERMAARAAQAPR
jgi:uncharacterized damage-inducible protein DinB